MTWFFQPLPAAVASAGAYTLTASAGAFTVSGVSALLLYQPRLLPTVNMAPYIAADRR